MVVKSEPGAHSHCKLDTLSFPFFFTSCFSFFTFQPPPTVLQAEGLLQEEGGGSFASAENLQVPFETEPDLGARCLRLSLPPSPFCLESRG